MRKPIIFFLSVFVLGVMSTAVYKSLDSTAVSEKTTLRGPDKKDKPEFPNEWSYIERAYPNKRIDTRSAQAAWTDFKQQRASRTAASTGIWETQGPFNIGGRITSVAISPVDDDVFYIGAASGGIFRTENAGETWEPIFDNAGRISIGSLAIAPTNGQRIYAGTGEANASGDTGAFFGDGVHRSDDGGDTWTSVGLEETQHVARIVVDPQDEDRLFAATTGVLSGKSETRGLYRSENGGLDWDQVLFVSDSTVCIDVVMHPTNTDTIYTAMWERVRDPFVRSYAGVTSGIHRSFDGGETWELLTEGLPEAGPDNGRIGLAISESDPNVLYATYTFESSNVFNGLYRSDDHGETWTLDALDEISYVNATFGWYFGNVRVHPTNPDDVLVLGQRLVRRTGQGGFWTEDFQMHVDFHDMAFSRNNNDFVLCANDGGLYQSQDGGINWQHYDNLPITQFYQIEVDELQPDRLFGGTQDNNTLRTIGSDPNGYEPILGGDGFHVNVDPTANNFVYAEYQFGNLFRSTDGGDYMDWALWGIDENDRNNWNTPVIISPTNPEVLYYGTQRLYKSTNRAQNWEPISNDLTEGLDDETPDGRHTLTTIAASAANEDVIYVGAGDGKVSYTYDGGVNWTTVEAGLPNLAVTGLALHPTNDQVAYVTFSGFRQLEYGPHIFKTEDGGQTWLDVNGNLPNVPINDVLLQEDPYRLIVATDLAVWYSDNDGLSWDILGENLPATVMSHLQYHEPTDKLYIGTYGRSMYSFDMSQLDFVGLHEEEAIIGSLRLYPNPAQDQLQYQLKENQSIDRYFITNESGAVVQEGVVKNAQESISVRALSNGHYVLHGVGKSDRVQGRFIVLK